MRIPLVLACAAALVLPLRAQAGVNAFTSTGPEGASGYEIEFVGGGALVVATSRGIYRSTDGGANWTLTRNIENYATGHLAVNPANRNQVLFGTAGGCLCAACLPVLPDGSAAVAAHWIDPQHTREGQQYPQIAGRVR